MERKKESGKKKTTLAHLAEMVGGETYGADDIFLTGVNDICNATEGEITFLVKAREIENLLVSRASAAIISREADLGKIAIPVIRVKDPYLAIALVHNYFISRPFQAEGIHPAASIGQDCDISTEVTIGPCAVLGNRVCLGKRVCIHAGVIIGDDVRIGDDCALYPNVTLYPSTIIGNRVIIHSGTVIGSDGFGYATDASGIHIKRPHVGSVAVEDDVEIGANVCIDRATFGVTRVGRGTKIDNLVQIGHNVQIGPGCLLVSQVGIAGSAKLGHHVVLGGQAAVAGHLQIGNRVMVGAKSGVAGDIDDGAVVSGVPAIAHPTWLRTSVIQAKLPEMAKELRDMKKKLNILFSQIEESRLS